MCVIVLQPAGLELSGNKFRNCWKRNSDGGGYCFAFEGTVVVRKGFFNMKEMLDSYRLDREAHLDSPFIIHFRISTSGQIDEENTHPHLVREDLAIAHNGHIMGWGSKDKSDTLRFTLKVLKHLPDGWETNHAILELLGGYLNTDKMVLLNGEGEYSIVNEVRGEECGGLWFSNKGYEKIKVIKPYKYTSGGYKKYTKGGTEKVTGLGPLAGTKTTVGATTVKTPAGYGIATTGKKEKGEVEDYPFLDEPCSFCSIPLDRFDSGACTDIGASDGVCFECLIDNKKMLYDSGIVTRPVDYLFSFRGEENAGTSPPYKAVVTATTLQLVENKGVKDD